MPGGGGGRREQRRAPLLRRLLPLGMGGSGSKLDRTLRDVPEEVKLFGLENFGATCYCNSVLQALYFCRRFREQLLEYYGALPNDQEESLLTTLGELFSAINSQKKKTGTIAPRKFVARLKKDNEIFRSNYMHQDAHEFLNFLLNESCEIVEKEHRRRNPPSPSERVPQPPIKTWIHDIFQGITVNETKCLCCENVTTRDEKFLDLSLEISPNSSITSCLRNFSSIEKMGENDKFYCDACCSHQEAHRRMRIKEPPAILALHLKRFKYVEELGRMKKLSYRVVFPFELKLCNTVDDEQVADMAYSLFAIVVHLGSRPDHGHYIALIRACGNNNHWLLFDDDVVTPIDESEVHNYFGMASESHTNTDHGYILLYERLE